jgi:drug/metabolite transporter (DMT)-like permease
MAATISWIFLGDLLVRWQWLGMAVALAGVAWVLVERTDESRGDHAPTQQVGGVFFAMLAAAMQAIAIVLSKSGAGACDAMTATVIAMLGALLGHAVLVTMWRRWPAMVAAARHGRVVLFLTVAALIGPFVGVVLSMIALQRAPTGVVATIIATMPILVLPFSILLFHEKISLRAIV